MNVLADRHHASLYHSLQLMARRFGWTLYTPVGHDWFDEWYWAFGRSTYNDDRLARQYLAVEPWTALGDGTWVTSDVEYPGVPIRGITLEEARSRPWAFVIATLQDNQAGFAKFAREQGAQLIFQVGNTGQQIAWDREPLVLNSSEMPLLGRGVQYHQEFDSAGMFGFRQPGDAAAVRCFVHLLDQTVCFPLWQRFRAALPDRDVLRYGHAPVDADPSYGGNIKPTQRIADLMAESAWGFHDKVHADGYGHVIHNWAAIGRPLIGHASHYRGKMAEIFWTPETSIDLDRVTVHEAAERVRTISAEDHRAMCVRIREIFDANVNFDHDAGEIALLLGGESFAFYSDQKLAAAIRGIRLPAVVM